MKTIMLLILSVFLSGCLSEEEKQARKDNAFDISGSWQTTADSEVQMSFEITNQVGHHDILVTNSTFAFAVLSETKQPVILPSNRKRKGENISRDFGESSEFVVCDKLKEIKKTNKVEGENIIFTPGWCLSGTVKKENKNLIEGNLRLTFHKIPTKTETNREFNLKYKAQKDTP